jgi:rod shape determining protein RodA
LNLLGPFNFQPSEIIKPFLLITFAAVASSEIKNKHLLLIILGVLPILSIYYQPDLGTTLVVLVGWASTVVSRLSIKSSLVAGLIAVLIGVPVVMFGLHDYQRQRLVSFANPYSDPLGNGYHVIQSIIAVGSGQMIGRGLGHGTQTQLKFLPEHHTDFIFASISEELGFIGAGLVLAFYAVMFWRIYRISQSVRDAKASLFCLSSMALLAFQTFVNIGMNLGLAPITGITLPLLSYGGSSLVSVAIILGLINSISRNSREDRMLIIH